MSFGDFLHVELLVRGVGHTFPVTGASVSSCLRSVYNETHHLARVVP